MGDVICRRIAKLSLSGLKHFQTAELGFRYCSLVLSQKRVQAGI